MSQDLGRSNLLRMLARHQMAQRVRGVNGDDDSGRRVRELGPHDKVPSVRLSTEKEEPSIIEKLLNVDESISSYMENGKYEEAYALVKRQYKQGSKSYFLKVLINYYVVLMQSDRPEKALKMEQEIILILQDTIDVSPSDAQRYGAKMKDESKHFETILFSLIARELCKTETDAVEIIDTLQRVALNIKVAVQKLLEQRKVTKGLVKKHIIPEMKKISSQVGNVKNLDRKIACVIQGLCMHHVEITQLFVGDLEGREKTLIEAVATMEDVLGKEAEKFFVYSDHLNNLGNVYIWQNRPEDALRTLLKAVETKKKAEDYSSALEKETDLQSCQNSLLKAQHLAESTNKGK